MLINDTRHLSTRLQTDFVMRTYYIWTFEAQFLETNYVSTCSIPSEKVTRHFKRTLHENHHHDLLLVYV